MKTSVYARLVKLVIPYWPFLVLSALSAFIYVIFNSLSIWLTASLFNNILTDFDVLIRNHHELSGSILSLNDTTVEEVFTHRKNIYSIDINLDYKKIIEKLNESNFTRVPFWKNNSENIIGVLDKRSLHLEISKNIEGKNIENHRVSKFWRTIPGGQSVFQLF